MTQSQQGCPLWRLIQPVPAPVRAAAPDPEAPPPRLLYSVREAAEQLSISARTLGAMLRGNAMPSVKLGGRRLIARADLENYVEQLRAEGG